MLRGVPGTRRGCRVAPGLALARLAPLFRLVLLLLLVRLLRLLLLRRLLDHRVVPDLEARRDHLEHALVEARLVVDVEARGDERGVVEDVRELHRALVLRVREALLLELLHDRVVRVDLHRLLRRHEGVAGRVVERLRLHEPLHVRRVPVLPRHDRHRGRGQPVRDHHLLDLVSEDLLVPLGQVLHVLLGGLAALLLALLLLVPELEVLLRRVHQLVVLELVHVLHRVLVDRVRHVQHLITPLLELLEEGRVLQILLVLARDVVDVLLALLHPLHVPRERHRLAVLGVGRLETEQLRELLAVLGVLDDPELDGLAEGLVELLEALDRTLAVLILLLLLLLALLLLLLLALRLSLLSLLLLLALVLLGLNGALLGLGHLLHHVERLRHQLLLDHLEDAGLLEHLARDVEGKVLRVDDSADERQVPGHEVVELIGDEDAAHVQPEVRLLRLQLVEKVRGRLLRDEQDRPELDLALGGEVDLVEGGIEVLGQRLEEVGVLVVGHVRRRAHPDRLGVVDQLPALGSLLHLLGLGLVLLLVLILLHVRHVNLVVILLLSLPLALRSLLGGSLRLRLLVRDLNLLRLGLLEEDGEVDELGVALDEGLELVLLEVLRRVLLDLHRDAGPAPDRVPAGVLRDGEGRVGRGLPDHLLVLVVLGHHRHVVGDQVHRVEANPELSDEVHVALLGHLLEERRRPGLGDRPQVVHQVVARHADARVRDSDGASSLVSLDVDLKLRHIALAQQRGVGEREEADLVEGVGRVGDELAQEDLLLRVERVDDDVHQAPNLRLELLLGAGLVDGRLLGIGEAVVAQRRRGGRRVGRRRVIAAHSEECALEEHARHERNGEDGAGLHGSCWYPTTLREA
mmetsp:Transcript_45038/g.106117  ORF Transcript_45038/g.106117 Transcript_45038/m.106117 type:complete len:860 (-) Transcript_45038:68-2647(-)